jgi:hypothetical protein
MDLETINANLEKAKTFIGTKARASNECPLMTIKEISQYKDMILVYFEENNYVCNIEVLKNENNIPLIEI